MILPLVPGDSPILRRYAEPALGNDYATLVIIGALWDNLEHYKGVGLAAPQIGHSVRLAVVDVNGQKFALINPVVRPVTAVDQTAEAEEGCLSLPGVTVKVRRPVAIRLVRAPGEPEEIVTGLAARVIQHEVDHLNGILITDYLVGATPPEAP